MKNTLNMSFSACLKAAVAWLMACTLLACEKDRPVAVTDPYPFPDSYTAGKDYSVHPGDSFFDYCNGAWLAANPIPSDPARIEQQRYFDADGPDSCQRVL